MEWRVEIESKEGKISTVVTKREANENCQNVNRVTNAIAGGTELSNDKIGPDCDRVTEIQGG
jgi:hypothetical protein